MNSSRESDNFYAIPVGTFVVLYLDDAEVRPRKN